MRHGASLVVGALVLLLGGCGFATSRPRADDAPAERPTAVPTSDGEVRTRYGGTVLDDGDGPQLCLGAIAASYPPQCEGLPLEGWSWDDLPGEFDDASGVRFGVFVVTGTFDGTTLTVTAVDGPEAADPYPASPALTTPCPVPEDGWRVLDPALTTERALTRTINTAERRDDFAAAWVDQGTSTQRERLRIQQELSDTPGMLGSAGDGAGFVVALDVLYDDGSLQAWADATYGEGLVEVSSALRPVD